MLSFHQVLSINSGYQVLSANRILTRVNRFWLTAGVADRELILSASAYYLGQILLTLWSNSYHSMSTVLKTLLKWHPFQNKVYLNFCRYLADIFIDRAKKVRNPTFHQAPASIRVYNDSRFRYSKRINFDVACQMDFRLYPVDKQVCEIKFESFGYTSQDMTLQWIDGMLNVKALYSAQHCLSISD